MRHPAVRPALEVTQTPQPCLVGLSCLKAIKVGKSRLSHTEAPQGCDEDVHMLRREPRLSCLLVFNSRAAAILSLEVCISGNVAPLCRCSMCGLKWSSHFGKQPSSCRSLEESNPEAMSYSKASNFLHQHKQAAQAVKESQACLRLSGELRICKIADGLSSAMTCMALQFSVRGLDSLRQREAVWALSGSAVYIGMRGWE